MLTPSKLGCMFVHVHCACSVYVTIIRHAESMLEMCVWLACSAHVLGCA
jgi:hypothetical protein